MYVRTYVLYNYSTGFCIYIFNLILPKLSIRTKCLNQYCMGIEAVLYIKYKHVVIYVQ